LEIINKSDRQKTLGFNAMTAEAKAQKVDEESNKYKELKQHKEAIRKEVAGEWGLAWPRVMCKDVRHGGPVPREQKWQDGLYEWVERIANGDGSKPDSPPSLTFPWDWKHKKCMVWDYQPSVGKEATCEEEKQKGESMELEEQKGVVGKDAQPKDELAKEGEEGQKRAYHQYSDDVIAFYFDFEKNMGGPRYKVCEFVVAKYPSLFPPSFNESRVRHWINKGKKPKGRGPGWRLGDTVLGLGHLAFLGTIIMAQYAAGVPMTSRLLVPLIVGALVGKGMSDKVSRGSRKL